MYNRILIANRGEIALRVMRACKEMGIETVAVFSEADRGASYVQLADEAYCLGGPRSVDSYLKIREIIAAAEVSGAEAIHPGFGFLSENAHFNEVCRDSGIDFIGPTPDAMQKLGDKNTARSMAVKSNVPVVPGSDGLVEDYSAAVKAAKDIGFPVLIKATAGGGGKGMRIATDEKTLETAIEQAMMEAQAAFGNPGVYLEKFVDRPRHVEVQIIGDQHGNICHLWERDCSTQRRHQKLIEESPSSRLPDKVRKELCESAVRMAKGADYYNAGTVEFIVDQSDNFYFIEVNARIQVEHPVTEMVTGIDLIKQQIRVAAGEKLPFKQKDIVCRGAAIECRINAEDPEKNFQPCPGTIEGMFVPGGYGVRFDSHTHAGYTVPPYYDSMIGKLIVHQPTREEAIACMVRCLRELRVKGIKTTADFQQTILKHPDFVAGTVDTKWVERVLLANNS
jgi:acetyl-CoA carboxylase, biotin carboxylase subunit